MKECKNDTPGYFILGQNDQKFCKRIEGNNDDPLLETPNGMISLHSLIEQAYNPKAAMKNRGKRGGRHTA